MRMPSAAALTLALLMLGGGSVPSAPAATLEGRVALWEQGLFGESNLQDRSNAVVFVAGFADPPPTRRMLELAQKDKSFATRVLAITAGEQVAFPNLDALHHNVWSKSKVRSFDLGLYKYPESKAVDFPRAGIVTVFCNIHPQMIATILVLPNNKYAVTPASGVYRVTDIPPGAHAVFAWVEGAEPVRKVMEFKEGQALKLDFRLQLKRIPLDHPNKEGQPYKKGDYNLQG